jgi:hypothetical protein
LLALTPDEGRTSVLAEALVRLGQGNGWGSTNADAEATLALADWLPAGSQAAPERTVELTLGEQTRTLALTGTAPALRVDSSGAAAGTVALPAGNPASPGEPLVVWQRLAYTPTAPGSQAAAATAGFALDQEVWTVPADGSVGRRVALDSAGVTLELPVGQVVEDHLTLVNPADRVHVAVVLPLAAGLEALNPALATAPPEARPSESLTLPPSYVAFLDDKVSWFYDHLPKGTYHFRVRARAVVPGSYTLPPAAARAMYDDAVNGNGNGGRVVVGRP